MVRLIEPSVRPYKARAVEIDAIAAAGNGIAMAGNTIAATGNTIAMAGNAIASDLNAIATVLNTLTIEAMAVLRRRQVKEGEVMTV
jgi:hypothetical protein